MQPPPIPRRLIHHIAATVDCDPTTVRAVLAGAPIKTQVRRNIAREIRRRRLPVELNEPQGGTAA